MSDLTNDLPQVDAALFRVPDINRLKPVEASRHSPRFLLLYGSLRERSFSRLLSEEAARLLTAMGAEVRTFNPSGLPLPDDAPESHPRWPNCVSWYCGRKGWCGARPNGTAQ